MTVWARKSGRFAKVYHITLYVDDAGGRRRITMSTGLRDKGAAQMIERRVKRLIDLKAAGEPPDSDLLRWLNNDAPSKLRAKLAEHGLLNGAQTASAKSIDRHVADYIEYCKYEGQAPGHIKIKESQLKRLVKTMGIRRLNEVTSDVLGAFLQQLQTDDKNNRSVNHNRGTISTFFNWCIKRDRAFSNPVTSIPRLNENIGQVRNRRAMSDDEILHLLTAVPPHRALIYKFFVFTGLRRGEVKSLRVRDLDLKREKIWLRGENTKNRTDDSIPIHEELLADLRQHLKGKKPEELVFNPMPRVYTFRADLQRAGIAPVDDQEKRLDLHALRGTFTTRLLQCGVSPAKAALLTRHKSVAVLEKHYNKLGATDAEQAMRSLPPLRLAANAESVSAATATPAKTDKTRAAPGAARTPPDPTSTCPQSPPNDAAAVSLRLVGDGPSDGYNSAADTGLPPAASARSVSLEKIAQVLIIRAISSVG